ncbi:SGNH/GDSL hydrolase family protein [Flavobacterium sp. ARAG 55.4]|uniref:SGNH/GDSL hydrolase family protein n=1 Tax=Flavobacterium sp. ARAG 55.4 TaxID=3451357 RepID=UPI003F4511C1
MITNKLRLILILSLFFTFLGYAQSLKSVSILGDSYSTFEGYMVPDTNFVWYNTRITQKTDVTSVKQTWWYQFIKDNNYKLELNNSFSGSTICNTGYQKQDYSSRSFIRRMDNLGSPDVIFIFGATNDAWANTPIGQFKYNDWTKEELYDFRPAMAYMLDYMLGRYPNVKIYFLLNSDLKETINESVKTICKHYNVDCIELKGIDKKEGHPSIKGMEQISNQISDFLSKK